jgi:hypothetical protein
MNNHTLELSLGRRQLALSAVPHTISIADIAASAICSGTVQQLPVIKFTSLPVLHDVYSQRKFRLLAVLRRLVAGFSPRRSGLAPRSVDVGFIVDKAAMGQVFLRVLRSSINSIPLLLRIHSCITLGTDSGPVSDPVPQRHSLTPWKKVRFFNVKWLERCRSCVFHSDVNRDGGLLGCCAVYYLNTVPPFQPWRWRHYVPPKRWHAAKILHGAITQKTWVERCTPNKVQIFSVA